MSDLITVQGVVLSAMPIGEYDKRIVLLTRERGKISAFAAGARRPNSAFRAAANALVFGSFELRAGRDSYYLHSASITHQFVDLAQRQPAVYYAYYFLELADYFGREGTDEREMMNLLFVTVKALFHPEINEKLVRCIFELRTMQAQGLAPELTVCVSCGSELRPEDVFVSQEHHGALCGNCARHTRDSVRVSQVALYTMQYILAAPLTKLYSFTVKEEVLQELEGFIHTYTDRNTDRHFKTLDILELMA